MKTLQHYKNTRRFAKACRSCGVSPQRAEADGPYWERVRHLIPLL